MHPRKCFRFCTLIKYMAFYLEKPEKSEFSRNFLLFDERGYSGKFYRQLRNSSWKYPLGDFAFILWSVNYLFFSVLFQTSYLEVEWFLILSLQAWNLANLSYICMQEMFFFLWKFSEKLIMRKRSENSPEFFLSIFFLASTL